MGTLARVKGIKRYKRRGQWYCYHRASGTRLEAEFGSPAFFDELVAAERDWQAHGGAAAKPGTLGKAIESYRASPAFERLKPRSQSDYQKVLDYLANIDEMPIIDVTTVFVAKLRDKTFQTRKRRFANYLLSVLGAVFKHAREYGLAETNPTVGVQQIPKDKDQPDANRPWSLQERRIVLDAAPAHLKPAITLGMFAGVRGGDVIRIPRNARQNGWLTHKTAKAGVTLQWPIIPELAEILDAAPAHNALTLVANSKGQPWKSENSFRSGFFKLIRRLESKGAVEPGLTFHGLRHTVATLLKERGVSDEDIAIALGQTTTRMARHYSRRADQRTRMTASVSDFNPLAGVRQPGDSTNDFDGC